MTRSSTSGQTHHPGRRAGLALTAGLIALLSGFGTVPAQAAQSAHTPGPKAAKCAAPTGLTGVAGDQQVSLTWTPTAGAVSYRLFRDYNLVGYPTTAAFTDQGLRNGTNYRYYVRGVNHAGAISQASATVALAPAAPVLAPVTAPVLTPVAAPVSKGPAPMAAVPMGPVPTRLAWFYKPPSSANESVVIQEFDTYVLTKGDETFVGKIRSAKPDAKVLQYFLLNQIVKPDAGSVEWRNNAANRPGDFSALYSNHFDWFLKDTNGKPIVDSTGKYYMMDPGNNEWRSYWLSRFTESNVGWDGLFLDNIDLSLVAVERYGVRARDYSEDATFTDAIAGFLKRIHNEYALPTGKPMSGNLVNGGGSRDGLPKYLGVLDGYMEEAFAADWHTGYLSASAWAAQLDRVDRFVSAGKAAILVVQGDSQTDAARQRFTFASYLLVAGPTVSYRYTRSGAYTSPWLYDNYASRLGSPVGGRRALPDGSVRRDFENGYVVVNPSTRGASIVTL